MVFFFSSQELGLWIFDEPKELKKYGVNYQLDEANRGFRCGYHELERERERDMNIFKTKWDIIGSARVVIFFRKEYESINLFSLALLIY